MIKNPAEVAEHFNSLFCSDGAELDSKIGRRSKYPVSHEVQRSNTLFYADSASNIKVEELLAGLRLISPTAILE